MTKFSDLFKDVPERDMLDLGLGGTLREEESPEESEPLVESDAIDTIADRIITALNQNDSIKPKTWNDVLRGLELVMKFRVELRGKNKKSENDLALQALQEFKEVVETFSRSNKK